MAISKVKLPDNSVHEIHDSRLPSVYPRIYVGTCSTAAATAAKVVTTEEFPLANGNPVVGTTIAVKFTNTNSGASPTLNVNSTGAHSIYYNNAVYTSSGNLAGYANRYTYYVWDGTYWVWLSQGASADVSGKQDKWANVNIADNAITLAPTESGGALILADNEQVVGLGYMHNDENDELAGAHMISAAPDGVKIQSFDDYGYKSIDFNGNGVAMNNTPIAGLPTPTDSDEAATKGYVDSAIPSSLSQLSTDSTHRLVTDAEKTTWNSKADILYVTLDDDSTHFADIYSALQQGKLVIGKYEDDDTPFYVVKCTSEEIVFWATPVDGQAFSISIDNTDVWGYSDNTYLVTDTEKSTWNAKYTKPSTGIPASDIASGVIPDGVFIAEIGVTSIADIVAAYNSGKAVFAAEEAEPNSDEYNLWSLSYIYTDTSNGEAVFTFYNMDTILEVTVNSSGWGQPMALEFNDFAQKTGSYNYNFLVGSLRINVQPNSNDYATVGYLNNHLTLTIPSGGLGATKTVANTDDIPTITALTTSEIDTIWTNAT